MNCRFVLGPAKNQELSRCSVFGLAVEARQKLRYEVAAKGALK